MISYYTCLVKKYVLAHLSDVSKSKDSTVKCKGGVLIRTHASSMLNPVDPD